MAHEVFICYASRDKAVAEAVCDALESKNIKCWIAPRDVLIGMQWAESIVDALDSSRVLVLVLSSSSNTSPQVIREIGRAASNDTPIIPIRIDDVVPSKAMDYFVSSHQWLDAQTGPLEKHLQRLVENVRQILARRRPPQEVIEIAEAEEKAKEAEEKAKREAEEAKKAARPVTHCPKCGAELSPNTSFCPKCGTRVSEAKKVKEAEERARREEAARARQEAEEARRFREAEEKARKEAEEARAQARREIEEARKAREAKERAKREAEKAREKARKEAEKTTREKERSEAKEAKEKAKREVEEAKKAPVFVERLAKPLLKRWWLWAGAGAAVVALILVLVFVLLPSETPSVSPPPAEEEEEEEQQQPPAEEEEEQPPAEEPEYGGTLVYRASFIDIITDPGDPRSPQFGAWLEALFTTDLTVPVDEFGYGGIYTPVEYRAGQLAESWEQPDPTTFIVHLRQGVQWQDKAPTYGREFTSDDVVYTYDMVMGAGEFAGHDPDSVFAPLIPYIGEVVATDDYTVEFYLNSTSPFAVENVISTQMDIAIRPREWYDLTDEEKADWHNVTGTGPFIIEDYVDGTALTYVVNPDYYGIDARYPVNKLPYVDELKVLCVPNMDTALAALRTGQFDLLVDAKTYPTLAETQQLAQTNPEINVFYQPVAAPGLFFAWDTEAGTILPPFDDINVRIAMQLAIDNALIAKDYYMGTVEGTLHGLMSPETGWGYPFDEWPAELQAEYGYDLEAAKALLLNAGLTSLNFEVLTTPDDYPEVLNIWQEMLKEIGINMTINAMEMMEQRPVVQVGNFEVLWTGATGSASNSPLSAIQSFYEGKFEAIGQGARANDPYYNELVEDFMAATTMAEAQDIFREADQYWLEQHWMVIGFPTFSYQMTQPWVMGYQGQSLWSLSTWTYFSHMWIDSDIRAQYLGE